MRRGREAFSFSPLFFCFCLLSVPCLCTLPPLFSPSLSPISSNVSSLYLLPTAYLRRHGRHVWEGAGLLVMKHAVGRGRLEAGKAGVEECCLPCLPSPCLRGDWRAGASGSLAENISHLSSPKQQHIILLSLTCQACCVIYIWHVANLEHLWPLISLSQIKLKLLHVYISSLSAHV